MDIHDILKNTSPEIQELFYAIDKAGANINSFLEKRILTLANDVFLGNREVCKLLSLSSRTLQDYRDKRLIAFYKLEGKILYKMSDIQQMLEKNYYDAWKRKR